ncbi:dUTPase [Filobacillus milosensis]|uniref:dUTPase n=1 Tax=Filobacillus milosensis TaxID=94137 RepID=A0A4Y8IX42_9BACI|nr:dUTP diphosphatase [Filobacillus milosensis]TFB24985.1 dUTPase [Filobacillus milosensis]
MNWDELYDLQKELDEKIRESHSLTRDAILEDKFLALLVEVSELANETRCFKFWSQKGPSDDSVILEEFVDGIHFILSLGLDFNYRYKQESIKKINDSQTKLFHLIIEKIYQFKQNPTKENYQVMMKAYIQLGYQLGFNEQEIYNAYLDKNKVNHNRQEFGY